MQNFTAKQAFNNVVSGRHSPRNGL